MKTLPLDKLDAFFTEAKNSGVFEQYYTEMATGLRRGELLGLKWMDIDFRNLTIFVRRQLLRLDGVVQEAPRKTNNSYRSISINQELADILKAKRERERGLSEYVFSSPNGGPLSPDSVLHMLHRALEGVNIKTLSGMLGHYSAGFTLDTYAHVTTMQREAAEKVGGFLQNTLPRE